jgi:beta-glucanase (GH16 family)
MKSASTPLHASAHLHNVSARHHVAAAALLAAALIGCGIQNDDDTTLEDADAAVLSQPLTTSRTIATFKTAIAGRFLGAEQGGGGAVRAVATQALGWERFTLIDLDGGALEHGDLVALETEAGFHLQAVGGGGGALVASTRNLAEWETFRIIRARGTGAVAPGDEVGLQALLSGAWVRAVDGGGGNVDVMGAARDTWETFTVSVESAADSWRLVWSDEMDGPAIDMTKWSYEVQGPYWVNSEMQRYTYARPENARIENGALVIEARRDFLDAEYTSARLKTQGKASWLYGRIEARIQVPWGRGTWPAFWLMPDDASRGWPACGEMDIMEHVGYEPNIVHTTLHSRNYNWRSTVQKSNYTYVNGAIDGYHVYAMEWYPDRIDVFVDGERYFSAENEGGGDDAWPFNKRFHIILNVAVGGDWGGSQGVDPEVWPQQMRVDWVRVYQR